MRERSKKKNDVKSPSSKAKKAENKKEMGAPDSKKKRKVWEGAKGHKDLDNQSGGNRVY